jgi:hypothetical protein
MRSKNITLAALLGSAFITIVAPAAAQNHTDDQRAPAKDPAIPQVPADSPSGIFGARGQLAISSDAGLSISNTSTSGRGGSTTRLELRPAVDYFIIDNLSLGGFLGLDYSKVPSGHSTAFSIGPRVGYNIPLSRLFSIWPKAGLSFTSVSQTINATGTDAETSTNSSNLAVNLFVPVMLHPAAHFFLGFGPALDADLTGDVKSTTIAGRLTIGGWI